MNYKGKLYGEKIRGKHFPLIQTAQDVDDLVDALSGCICALEYAAFDLDGTKDENVPSNITDITDTTSPSYTAILAARRAKEAIKKFK